MKKIFFLALGVLSLPLVSSAQVVASGPTLGTWMRLLVAIVKWLPPFLISIAVLLLIWNVVRYVIAGNVDAKGKKEALKSIWWSFLGLVFVLSIWGILALISSTLQLRMGGDGRPVVPTVSTDPLPF